ncbi:Hypothetical predicted protein [Lecanosticta acicola]|uniref:Uncharacterized protein n=1 Tax=Lecanosticta acicola TaxID=111012 RepID=A0AAI8Z5H1_9PEZI|nr:Hypothetical predicted protein [Lecanosticta acicola]
MAPGTSIEGNALADGRSPSVQPNGNQPSPSPSAQSTDSPSADQPPTKKPRLKLNVRQPKAKGNVGETIAVSRPRRETNVRFRYSQDMVMRESPEPPKRKALPKPEPVEAASPASSGLSSLVSAPPSEREESPFQDPSPPPEGDEYGVNFLSYYVDGNDEDVGKQGKAERPKAKPKSRANAKQKSKAETETAKEPGPTASATPAPPPSQTVVRPDQQPMQKQHPPLPPPAGPRQSAPPPLPQQMPPQQMPHQQHQNQGPRPQHIPPPYPTGPPSHRPPQHLPPPPPPMPQPVIQFIDIKHDPKPQRPDTVAEMVRKLDDLCAALTNFGGVPVMPPTPPPEKPAKKSPKESRPSANPLDNFLSHFHEDDDSDEERDLDYQLIKPGAPDGPLTYGIQFIQNALKSWAQQRLTHQVTQQYQAQHQQQMHQQQMQQAQRRGPGRPRRYDEPDPHPVGPPAVIHTDLAATPEGVAIKAFQSVLDSGCLQVNAVLPIELSCALRHLYMQIDHLINQGSKAENNNWQCMSYSAQISANKARVDKCKADQAKAQEQMAKQQQIIDQHRMAQLGFAPQPSQPLAADQAQQQHAIDLERKRSMQHAVQQPYISQQHLNPLQLGARSNGTPVGTGVPPASNDATPKPHPATSPQNGAPPGETDTRQSKSSALPDQDPKSRKDASQVQLDKVKIYMPGFLPRSGQSMKFSFAPNSENAVRVFGTEAFPVNEQGPKLPNRGPMSAPLTQPGGDAQTPINLDGDVPGEKAFEAKPRPSTGGWNPVNAQHNAPVPSNGQSRPNSVPARPQPAASEHAKGR